MSLRLMGWLLAAMIASSPALACKGRNVILADDFTTPDAAWGDNDDSFIIGSGTLQLKPAPGSTLGGVYQGELFEDADICIDMVMPTGRNPPNGGLLFWWQDWDNAYLFQADATGSAAVFRWQRGRGLFPVSWRKAPSLKTAANAVNTLRLTLKGGTATAYINDQRFATFKGNPPQGGGMIGAFGASENGVSNTWTFSNLKVTDLP